MDLALLQRFAESALAEYGLVESGWRFAFDHARVRFGCCRYRERLITVSRHLAAANPAEACYDTVLHEVAHALAGPKAGHGPKWKQKCVEVGAQPVRCYRAADVERPAPAYWAVCPHCERRVGFYRKPRRARACGPCCRTHAGGVYDARFAMRLEAAR